MDIAWERLGRTLRGRDKRGRCEADMRVDVVRQRCEWTLRGGDEDGRCQADMRVDIAWDR